MSNIFWVVQIKNKHIHTHTHTEYSLHLKWLLIFYIYGQFWSIQTKNKNEKLPLFPSLSKVLKVYFHFENSLIQGSQATSLKLKEVRTAGRKGKAWSHNKSNSVCIQTMLLLVRFNQNNKISQQATSWALNTILGGIKKAPNHLYF